MPTGHLRLWQGSMRDYIAGLTLPTEKTVWDDYAENNSYDDAETGRLIVAYERRI